MKPISGNRVTTPQPADAPGSSLMPAAYQAKGRWDLGTGAFKIAADTHSLARGLVSEVCPEMPALSRDRCAEKLVADAKLALREVDIDVS
jgi:hypothetical protein